MGEKKMGLWMLLASLLCAMALGGVVRPRFTVNVVLGDVELGNLTDLSPQLTTPFMTMRVDGNGCQPRVSVQAHVLRAWAANMQIAAVAKAVCAQVPIEAFNGNQYRYDYMCLTLLSCRS